MEKIIRFEVIINMESIYHWQVLTIIDKADKEGSICLIKKRMRRERREMKKGKHTFTFKGSASTHLWQSVKASRY